MDDGWSRRGVLAATAAAGTAGLTGTAGAQARITTRMIIPEMTGFLAGDDYGGYFLHVGEQTTADEGVDEFDDCEFDSWPPASMATFDARLIDRLEDRHREQGTQMFVPSGADVDTGTLWVVNRTITCPGEYVGLEVERIGSGFVVGNESAGDGATETGPNAPLPGFGPLAALAAVVAGGYALARRAAEE
jgi:hypothetical protein